MYKYHKLKFITFVIITYIFLPSTFYILISSLFRKYFVDNTLLLFYVFIVLFLLILALFELFQEVKISATSISRKSILFHHSIKWNDISEVRFSRFMNQILISYEGRSIVLNFLYKDYKRMYNEIIDKLTENQITVPDKLVKK